MAVGAPNRTHCPNRMAIPNNPEKRLSPAAFLSVFICKRNDGFVLVSGRLPRYVQGQLLAVVGQVLSCLKQEHPTQLAIEDQCLESLKSGITGALSLNRSSFVI
jgi:hypothetical protein